MAEPSISELGLLTLRHGNAYAIFDRNGDISPELGVAGLYIDDMRYGTALTLLLGSQKPVSNGAEPDPDGVELIADLHNPAMTDANGLSLAEGAVKIERRITVCDGMVHQKMIVRNETDQPVRLPLSVDFDGDFVDMFAVRGGKRAALGKVDPATVTNGDLRVSWRYHGTDRIERDANIFFSSDPGPASVTDKHAEFVVDLPPGGTKALYLESGKFKADAVGPGPKSYNDAVNVVRDEHALLTSRGVSLEFSDSRLQSWFDQSLQDLAFLTTYYHTGPYPCAGVPWFSVPFGRDGIVTALEMLWARPELARGVLKFLSERQATHVDPTRDAEPGKIMHETRLNEMSRIGQVPFSLYYGGVDTTMLYVVLAGEYLHRTGDKELIKELWPNIRAALGWMEQYGTSKDGFVVYEKKAETGLTNQNWKDSVDSVFYEDGDTNVKFPRAVAEVQGYAYAAWRTGAELAALMHDDAAARAFEDKAEKLYTRFNREFWDRDGFYDLAIDGEGRACRVRASNMGQLLFTGIVPSDRADKVAALMTGDDFFTGFGVRTVREGEAKFDPQSYHNGSVWPHDTALIARGLGQTGHTAEAAKLVQGLLRIAEAEDYRMPELVAGHQRTEGQGPVSFPHACRPQAWAAATAFQGLQALLGLDIDAANNTVQINPSSWPAEWGTINVRDLEVGSKKLSFSVDQGGLHVLENKDGVRIVTPSAAQRTAPPSPSP